VLLAHLGGSGDCAFGQGHTVINCPTLFWGHPGGAWPSPCMPFGFGSWCMPAAFVPVVCMPVAFMPTPFMPVCVTCGRPCVPPPPPPPAPASPPPAPAASSGAGYVP
jgi:hypothetical protein